MRVFEEWVMLKGMRCLRGSNPGLSELEVRHTLDDQWMHHLIDLKIGETLQIGTVYIKRLS